MKRFCFEHAGLTFSYLDSGDPLPILIALHAHWMEGSTFVPLAGELRSEWRIVALDQRGHGYSDHAETYSREDYLGDLDALFAHLQVQEAVLLGNSLGGVNAYQYAARRPERIRALIIEDIGVVEAPGDMPPYLNWAGVFPTREELEGRIGQRFAPYLRDSFRETAAGWRLAFEPREMMLSQACLEGNYWRDWLSTSCPALVIRGSESRVTTAAHITEMVSRRTNTQMLTLTGGHVVHSDDPVSFAQAVRSFLALNTDWL
jgi:esterase